LADPFDWWIVPRQLRADWRQEWKAELNQRERLLAEWDRLDWLRSLIFFGEAPAPALP
jgi:hypothetical protein